MEIKITIPNVGTIKYIENSNFQRNNLTLIKKIFILNINKTLKGSLKNLFCNTALLLSLWYEKEILKKSIFFS
jgi:hypothetical protein